MALGIPPSQQILNSRSKIATAWPDFRNAPTNSSCMVLICVLTYICLLVLNVNINLYLLTILKLLYNRYLYVNFG